MSLSNQQDKYQILEHALLLAERFAEIDEPVLRYLMDMVLVEITAQIDPIRPSTPDDARPYEGGARMRPGSGA